MQPPTFVFAAERAPAAAAAARGEAFPFAEILCAEAPRLRRLVHRLFGWSPRTADVDDVVQEALLAAWRHRATFRGEAGVATWLVQIVVRKARSHARAANLRRRVFRWWRHNASEPAVQDGESPLQERLDATHAAMAALRHADREVLVLRYLEQRGVDQIAQVLECSRAAVDARLSRARKRLRAKLRLEVRP
ncbi:MAG: sigma-70 family RNA polymerase sigma factor [Planctomycetes bacterium]|nr:sigma-70 family RNA polymerase sigma factor [Planctomycetota bacterium]